MSGLELFTYAPIADPRNVVRQWTTTDSCACWRVRLTPGAPVSLPSYAVEDEPRYAKRAWKFMEGDAHLLAVSVWGNLKVRGVGIANLPFPPIFVHLLETGDGTVGFIVSGVCAAPIRIEPDCTGFKYLAHTQASPP